MAKRCVKNVDITMNICIGIVCPNILKSIKKLHLIQIYKLKPQCKDMYYLFC